MRLALLALALAAIAGAATASDRQPPQPGCTQTRITRLAHDGPMATPYVVITRPGERFLVLGQDLIDVRAWRAGDRLSVCRVEGPGHPVDLFNQARRERLAAAADDRLQVLAGRTFDRLVARSGRRCPTVKVRYTTPADLLDLEETFIDGLTPAERARFDAASRPERCARRDGASCPAHETLRSLAAAGLFGKLVDAVCERPPAAWR